ncbi:hypothetical protein AC579_5410 [Pseudocercospora musae]|uniref:histidine kinase n=1 Tax=Pseudocercospora musae TaxID=113226 RepID=A0A139I1D7_9PEZI|nr:hypothetical protein AC579_5410 [Pseudocercospora musae]
MVNLVKRRANSIRSFDWTRDLGLSSDFQRCTRENVDWIASPLGPMLDWPASLRQMVLVCLADSAPSAVLWGPDTAIVYNEPFSLLIGNKHPQLQGQLVNGELSDVCADLDAVWQRQAVDGSTVTIKNQRIRQERLGFVEERTYHWKLVPIIGDDGFVTGSLVSLEDNDKVPPRRERSKSAAREFGNAIKGAANTTASNILRLEQHFSGKTCNCEKLWEATQQLRIHEQRYEKFADFAPVGIAALDKDYQVEWANKAYFDTMAAPEDAKSFFAYLHPEDVAMAQVYFDTGAFRDDSFTFECRLKKWAAKKASSPLESPRPLEPSPSWVLVSAYREFDHGQHTMCWLIDITAHKNAEEFLRKRMDEAVEMRQQKERFIDLISHEIRNPLSAMTHCIDDIIETAKQESIGQTDDVLEAAQTISYCTQHIKNIVGDVLTLSKLDSRLVEICPRPTQPKLLIQEALKMFDRELRASAIDLELDIDPSLAELEVDWLMMDPGRFLQVLINLTTNAIKVVKDRSKRRITVTLSATHGPACKASDEVQCVLPRQVRKPVDFPQPHDQAKSMYLVCSVEDTGPGLEKHELASLFERFAQENPKTESRYGGSGLGLFISRDLTELQGGRIGVASQPGVGSKFVFSVEVKRATEPAVLVQGPSVEITRGLQASISCESPVAAKPAAVLPTQEPLRGQGIIRKDSLKDKDKPSPRKLLIVEDNSINAKVLSNQLRKRGYDVSVAIHGEEALEKLQMTTAPSRHSPISTASTASILSTTTPTVDSVLSTPIRRKPVPSSTPTVPPAQSDFDVVLMDIEMPVMDGLTCAQQIRAFEANSGAYHRLPIIAVTANVRSEHGSAALEAGMDAITTKPYKVEDLVRQIEQFVN